LKADGDILRVENLSVSYGTMRAVWSISFNVKEKSITALLGSNGAGKSSTLHTVAGLLSPSEGKIYFGGKDLTAQPAHMRVQDGLALVPEGRGLWPYMTVEENLEYGAYSPKARGNVKDTMEWVFKLFPLLKERRKQLARSLSGGEQQMLAIARGLMCKPKLLMLDEPSLGLMPTMVSKIFETVEELRGEGVTILLVEQNVLQTLRIADEAYVMENGRIRMHSSGEELLNDPHVKTTYLGL